MKINRAHEIVFWSTIVFTLTACGSNDVPKKDPKDDKISKSVDEVPQGVAEETAAVDSSNAQKGSAPTTPVVAPSSTPAGSGAGWLDAGLKTRFALAMEEYVLTTESYKEIETEDHAVYLDMTPKERSDAKNAAKGSDGLVLLKDILLGFLPGIAPYVQLAESVLGTLGAALQNDKPFASRAKSICARKFGDGWHYATATSLRQAEEDGLIKNLPDLSDSTVWIARKNPNINLLPTEVYTFGGDELGMGFKTNLGFYDPAKKKYGVMCAKREH